MKKALRILNHIIFTLDEGQYYEFGRVIEDDFVRGLCLWGVNADKALIMSPKLRSRSPFTISPKGAWGLPGPSSGTVTHTINGGKKIK